MNIYLNIEKLISYAKLNLLLDEANEYYVRNAIMFKLGLRDYESYEVDEEEIESYENPFGILNNLFAYALDKKLYAEEDRNLFYAEFMDIVSMRPGEIADTFDSLCKSPAKALDWVFEYAIKNGSAKMDFQRWENKGDNKVEVVFADCCGGNDEYPGCCACVEGEGYGTRKNERFVRLPIDGNWYYKAAKNAYSAGMGRVVNAEHKPLTLDKEAIDLMFDFIEMAPSWYICTGECEETESHAKFVCGEKLMPIHKAGEVRKFKSKDYPYINITASDWYLGAIKLGCTNREKLVEFTLKLIDAYKNEGGKVFISVRKVESKFTVELAFMRGEVKKEHSAIAPINICAMAGVFRISSKTAAQIKMIEKFLTGEQGFTPMSLVGGMEAHAKMIDRLLKETGNKKLAAAEAEFDVKEECKKVLVASLNDIRAFNDSELEVFLQKF